MTAPLAPLVATLGLGIYYLSGPAADYLALPNVICVGGSWVAPAAYADGGAIPPTDPLRYDAYYSHDGLADWTLITPGDIVGTNYTFNGDMAGQAWYFTVKAKNSCAASPKVSAASNVFRECEGAFGVYCPTFTVSPASAVVGAAVTIAAPDICLFKGNGNPADQVVVRVGSPLETKDFTLEELPGDGGSFAGTITITEGATSGAGEVRASGGSTLAVYLYTTDLVLRCTKYVAVTGGVCTTTPKAPSPFTAVRSSSGGKYIDVTGTGPSQNADNSAIADLAGYRIESAYCSSSSNCEAFGGPNALPAVDVAPVSTTGPTTHRFSGLTAGRRYKFRMRAFDSCATRVYSVFTPESNVLTVR